MAAAGGNSASRSVDKNQRDEYVAAQWKFHNSMDGGRTSVESQFGPDSNEVQAVGRKKRSEYKSRTTKPTNGGV